MSAILKFEIKKIKQLHLSEVNYPNYTKKDPILHVATTFSLKQGETRTNSVPIPHPLRLGGFYTSRVGFFFQLTKNWLLNHVNLYHFIK